MKVYLVFYNITKPRKRRAEQNQDADEFKKQNAINGNRIISRNMEYLKETILVNSSTNSNLKPRHLSGELIGA